MSPLRGFVFNNFLSIVITPLRGSVYQNINLPFSIIFYQLLLQPVYIICLKTIYKE